MNKKLICLTGGTGFIGKQLTHRLLSAGYEVRQLMRKPKTSGEYLLDIETGQLDAEALDGAWGIIHLAGASIARRWTDPYKKEMYASRIDTANLIHKELERRGQRIEVFASASGTNYYGTQTQDRAFVEGDSPISDDFLARLCADWENAAMAFTNVANRVCILRTAPVFGKNGGSLQSLRKVCELRLGGALGDGQQWFPWIHMEDVLNIYELILDNAHCNGAYNAVAPEYVRQEELMKTIGKALGKRQLGIPVPSFVVKLAMGEMSEMLLKASPVKPKRLEELGYTFSHPILLSALKNIFQESLGIRA